MNDERPEQPRGLSRLASRYPAATICIVVFGALAALCAMQMCKS